MQTATGIRELPVSRHNDVYDNKEEHRAHTTCLTTILLDSVTFRRVSF
jgi:hypothetical protein